VFQRTVDDKYRVLVQVNVASIATERFHLAVKHWGHPDSIVFSKSFFSLRLLHPGTPPCPFLARACPLNFSSSHLAKTLHSTKPPSVVAARPSKGTAIGGESIAIEVSDVALTKTVAFGDIEARVLSKNVDTRVLSVVAPPGLPGKVPLSLVDFDGVMHNSAVSFTYTESMPPRLLLFFYF